MRRDGLSKLSEAPSGDLHSDLGELRRALAEFDGIPDQEFFRAGTWEKTYYMDRRIFDLRPSPEWLPIIASAISRPPDWWVRTPDFWEGAATVVLVEWLHHWPSEVIPTFRRLMENPGTRIFAFEAVSSFTDSARYELFDELVELLEPYVQEGMTDEEAVELVPPLAGSGNQKARDLFARLKQQIGPHMPSAERELSLIQI